MVGFVKEFGFKEVRTILYRDPTFDNVHIGARGKSVVTMVEEIITYGQQNNEEELVVYCCDLQKAYKRFDIRQSTTL